MNKKGLFTVLVICIALMLPGGKISVKATEKDKRVMFISSFSYSWDSVRKQIDGIEKGLDDYVAFDCVFMDTGNIYDETAISLFYNRMEHGSSTGVTYDAIILGGDPALSFALEYGEELFPDVPMLFIGVNDEKLVKEALENSNISGSVESFPIEENIAFGLRVQPNARKVYAVVDNSATGIIEGKRFLECADKFPQLNFQEINASELTTEELEEVLRSVEKENILMYITMKENADGNRYSTKTAVDFLTENSAVPIVRVVDSGIGDGLLGGYVLSKEETGRQAALTTMAILEGRNQTTVSVILKEPYIYMIDEAVARKFDVKTFLFPEDTVIVNRTPSYFERNREVLVPGGVLCLAMIAIILIVGIDNLKRRKLMEQLEDSRKTLESASQHDFLTGLPNRSKFMEDFENLVESKCPCTIMMIDIDNFKSINDNNGHNGGDEALQQLAKRLKEIQTPILNAYRFAGDEFILILKSNQNKIVERAVLQCKTVFEKPFTVCDKSMKINGSIGVASYPDDADDPEKLVICADDAMYQVKKNGKNDAGYYKRRDFRNRS